ncbi:FliM/FliN family flagellar motor C-terminal domain-containing protein [Neisseriaceae bacterium TC5R-5]|nr:FliM/FliN family flagellar motor C-terminal domain-containing protein [Neisseriaceae bacterium TC5R-5]
MTSPKLWRLYRASERQRLANDLNIVLQQWHCDWTGSEASHCQLTVTAIHPDTKAAAGYWQASDEQGQPLLALAIDANSEELLAAICFGQTAPSGKLEQHAASQQLLQQARQALLGALAADRASRFSQTVGSSLALGLTDHGSLQVQVVLGAWRLQLYLSAQLLNDWLPVANAKPAALAPFALKQLPASVSLPVVASLHSSSLSVAQLLSLQPGDVIRLDHLLTQPLRCHIRTGELLAEGKLGKQGERWVVQLS